MRPKDSVLLLILACMLPWKSAFALSLMAWCLGFAMSQMED